MFEVRNEDGQIISQHSALSEALKAAARYRRDRDMAWTFYSVFAVFGDTTVRF